MKRILTSALIIMLAIGAAQAQNGEGNSKGHNKEHKMAAKKMNLTEDQKARLQAIREDYKKEAEALKNNTALSAEEKQTRTRALHEQFRNKSQAVLTPEQREQQAKRKEDFKAIHEDRNGKFHKDGAGNMHNGMGKRKDFEAELGLTADQQAKVTSIRSSFKPKFEALRNNTSLTEEQKRAKMKELMKQQREQMKAVLTAEQIKKMEASRHQYSKRKNK